MSQILLDTNALLWIVSAPERISEPVRDMLADNANELIVSAASAWEVAIKTRLGRLDGLPLLSAWDAILDDLGATDLAIDSTDAIAAGRLNWGHKDPFDRVIVAQAARRGFVIATSDERMIDGAIGPVLDTRGGSIA